MNGKLWSAADEQALADDAILNKAKRWATKLVVERPQPKPGTAPAPMWRTRTDDHSERPNEPALPECDEGCPWFPRASRRDAGRVQAGKEPLNHSASYCALEDEDTRETADCWPAVDAMFAEVPR